MKFTKLSTILLSLGMSVCLTTGCSDDTVDNEGQEQQTTQEEQIEETEDNDKEGLSKEYKLGYESGVNIADAGAYNDIDEIIYHIKFDHVNSPNPEEFKYPSYITGMFSAFFDKGIEYKDEEGNIIDAETLVINLIELYEDDLDKGERNKENIQKQLDEANKKLEEGPIE